MWRFIKRKPPSRSPKWGKALVVGLKWSYATKWLKVNNPQCSEAELEDVENPRPPAPDGAEQRQKALSTFRMECLRISKTKLQNRKTTKSFSKGLQSQSLDDRTSLFSPLRLVVTELVAARGWGRLPKHLTV